MTRFLTLTTLATFLFATVALATPMKRIKPLPGFSNETRCYKVEATLGWQTVTLPMTPERQILTVVGPDNISPRSRAGLATGEPIGWSVDDTRYKRVGANGHLGKDGAALERFAAFKFEQGAPFGALLIRQPNGRIGAFKGNGSPLALPSRPYYDFRVNDQDDALADNGGYLILCFLAQRFYD